MLVTCERSIAKISGRLSQFLGNVNASVEYAAIQNASVDSLTIITGIDTLSSSPLISVGMVAPLLNCCVTQLRLFNAPPPFEKGINGYTP
jgi:hypothetical protein